MKVIEGNADTIIRHPTVKILRVPPAWRGGRGEERRYDKANHRQPHPANRQHSGGGRDGERRIEGERRRYDKEPNVKALPQAAIVAGGETKRRKPRGNGRVSQPTVPRGEKCLVVPSSA